MDLRSHLRGNKQAQLIEVLLRILSTSTDATASITTKAEFGLDDERHRIVFHDGTSLKVLATIDDVYDGHGNTTYISETEPSGIADVGLVNGDQWYNPTSGEVKLVVDRTATTEDARWTNITGVNVTFTLPYVQVDHAYAALSVFVYHNGTSVTNANESLWQNQTTGSLSTPSTIASESDLSGAGFVRIAGGTAPDHFASVTIDNGWVDGSTNTVGSASVVRTGSSYAITLPSGTVRTATVKKVATNEVIRVDTVLSGSIATVSFADSITEDFEVIIGL